MEVHDPFHSLAKIVLRANELLNTSNALSLGVLSALSLGPCINLEILQLKDILDKANTKHAEALSILKETLTFIYKDPPVSDTEMLSVNISVDSTNVEFYLIFLQNALDAFNKAIK